MRGPAGKHPSVRARVNQASTKRILHTVSKPKIPPLPDHTVWSKPVLDFWNRAFSSPMSDEWTDSDIDAMYVGALLLQTVWDPETSQSARVRAAGELRQFFNECGLTPMSRRRLQWQIEQGESASDRTAARRSAKTTAAKGAVSAAKDPREARRA